MKNKLGFTLIEILVALFVFSILSGILVGALHRVIGVQEGVEIKAEQLRRLQVSILLMSRDIQQAVNRPGTNSVGKAMSSFVGTSQGFTLTHIGYTSLQRVGYEVKGKLFLRYIWPKLDMAPKTLPSTRELLTDVVQAQFYFLDKENRFRSSWPIKGEEKQPLPRAVKVVLTLSNWGQVQQLFVIPIEVHDASKKTNT